MIPLRHDGSPARRISWFWRSCHWLSRRGFVRKPEGAPYTVAEWEWSPLRHFAEEAR